jgi:hypothetical protein
MRRDRYQHLILVARHAVELHDFLVDREAEILKDRVEILAIGRGRIEPPSCAGCGPPPEWPRSTPQRAPRPPRR